MIKKEKEKKKETQANKKEGSNLLEAHLFTYYMKGAIS